MDLNQIIAQRLVRQRMNESKTIRESSSARLGDEITWKGKKYTIISDEDDQLQLRPSDMVDDDSFDGYGDSYDDVYLDREQLDEDTDMEDSLEGMYSVDGMPVNIHKISDDEYSIHDQYGTHDYHNASSVKAYIKGWKAEKISEDLSIDDDPEETEQKYNSAKTSINSSKLPALFKLVKFAEGSLNLDYGGGKFDNVAEYLDKTYGATNLVYDKYNRTPEHNREVLSQVRKNGGADTVTCSNVLNVIAEESERLAVLRNCKRFMKSSGNCYITVYEGNGSGEGKPSSSGYQLNRKTAEYEEEIKSVFPGAIRKGKLWICK